MVMAQSNPRKILATASWLLPLALLAQVRGILSAEVNLVSSLRTEYIAQKVDREDDDELSLQSYTVTPNVTATFISRTINASFSGTHTYLKRENETISAENNFSAYQSALSYSPFGRVFTLTAQSSLQYRADTGQNFITSNFISNPEGLAKATRHNVRTMFQSTEGDYVNALADIGFTKAQIERAESVSDDDFDSNNVSAMLNLYNGDDASFFYWRMSGQFQESQRGNNAYGDFRSLNGNAQADFMMLSWLGVSLTGTAEHIDTTAPDSAFENSRRYNTFGAGLTLRQGQGRTITVTLNGVDTQTESADDDNFIATDINWAFSNRTSFMLRLNKRFFGRSAQSALNYNSKYFRASLGYTETVTNTTRLLSSVEDLGLFVCPASFTDISECQQPDSVDYTPQPGETLAQFSQNVFELDDNIILRKALNAVIGYSFSRLNMNLSFRHAEDEELGFNRQRNFDSLTLTTSLAASRDTTLLATFQYSDIEGQSQALTEQSSKAKQVSLNARHTIGKNLNANLTLTVIEQKGNLGSFGLFGNDFTDTRLTLGLRYELR